MTDALKVLTPGAATTVQDRGRFDFQHMGVPVSGAADVFAYRVANHLVGNSVDCAVLESTLIGPRLEVLCPADIALTGALMTLSVNGQRAMGWRSIHVRPGDLVDLGAAENGCRAYLAITGGIDTPPIMGSRSTYLGGKLGGIQGRPLKGGDVLQRGLGDLLDRPRRLPWHPLYGSETYLRAIAGPQEDFFKSCLSVFFEADFSVTAQANRMGYRLSGPTLARDPDAPVSIISEPVVPGSVQVPADGQPIILLSEQTLGGYAKIATVISTDLFKIAQAKPGDTFRFVPVTLAQAHEIGHQWAAYLNQVEELLCAAA